MTQTPLTPFSNAIRTVRRVRSLARWDDYGTLVLSREFGKCAMLYKRQGFFRSPSTRERSAKALAFLFSGGIMKRYYCDHDWEQLHHETNFTIDTCIHCGVSRLTDHKTNRVKISTAPTIYNAQLNQRGRYIYGVTLPRDIPGVFVGAVRGRDTMWHLSDITTQSKLADLVYEFWNYIRCLIAHGYLWSLVTAALFSMFTAILLDLHGIVAFIYGALIGAAISLIFSINHAECE